MEKITIHTATYNRAYILSEAYNSLQNQTCKDFEWIITDDGSVDNTEELVKRWINETTDFTIIYNKLSHVGIPRALNSGVNLAHTEWFMMLDSDDYLKSDAVAMVVKWIEEIENDKSFVGIGFGKQYPNGEYMKNQTPLIDEKKGYIDATNIEREKYNLDMDMCEVSRISVLKEYPFQYWPTEKYAPEQLNYNQIALAGYKYRWFPNKLYVCDYLPDGQTRDNKIVKHNPMGFAMMYNQNLLLDTDFKRKCKDAMQMNALSICSGNVSYIFRSNRIGYNLIMLPFGIALALRRKIQFSKME